MFEISDRLFDAIFVRPPPSNYDQCVSSHSARDTIDVTLAKRQHRDYISILKESKGLQVIELQPLTNLPDSVFVTDPAILGLETCIIGRFGERSRREENQAIANELRDYGDLVGEIRQIRSPGTMEGGDILVTEEQIFAGVRSKGKSIGAMRTNSEGVRQLRKYSKLSIRQVKSNTFHLLCACSHLHGKEILLAPEVLSPDSFRGYKFVSVPREELYASEVLYLGEERVMIPAGYPRTARKLKEGGYDPIEVDLSEFYKGDGGVSCLSAPVYKML